MSLNGDLQHAGVHFRASNEVAQRKTETSYLWEPDLPAGKGRIVSDDLKWSRLLFPIGERWYAAQQINAPGNPVTELSWRDYVRFGYFFKRALKKGDKLDLRFRFVIWETAEPAQKPKQSAAQIAESRRRCQGHFESFVKFLEK